MGGWGVSVRDIDIMNVYQNQYEPQISQNFKFAFHLGLRPGSVGPRSRGRLLIARPFSFQISHPGLGPASSTARGPELAPAAERGDSQSLFLVRMLGRTQSPLDWCAVIGSTLAALLFVGDLLGDLYGDVRRCCHKHSVELLLFAAQLNRDISYSAGLLPQSLDSYSSCTRPHIKRTRVRNLH